MRGVSGFLETKSDAFVSEDGQSTYVAVQFDATEDDELQDTGEALVAEFEGDDDVLVGGNAVAQQQINENVESDLQRAELLAFPILFLLSLLFFRSLVAAILPLLIGGLAIVSTFLLLTVASELGSISIFALNLVTGLGLGLAIDYSLFVVSRYREEIAKTGAGMPALRRTMATAGRTVAYSSITVAGALAALAIFPQRFLYSMGIGGALVALAAALIALTVLPAILALLGERVNSLSPKFLQRRARGRLAPRLPRLLVPPLAHSDAIPGTDRPRQRDLPHRARHPVLLDRVHLGRRPGPARGHVGTGGRRPAPSGLPAVPRFAVAALLRGLGRPRSRRS